MTDGHLTPSSPAGWRLWRHVLCRSAGFPLSGVLALSDAGCVESADTWAEASGALQRARQEVTAELRRRMAELRIALAQAAPSSPARDEIATTLRALQDTVRRATSARGLDPSAQVLDSATREGLRAAEERARIAQGEFQERYARAVRESTTVLRRDATDARLREAVAWQNLPGLRHGVDRLHLHTDDSSRSARKALTLVAAYVNRYATKNDTIGFFGPVGWARIEDAAGPLLRLESGTKLLASRRVYFEDWAVRELARRLSSSESLRPWLIPRRAPQLHWDGECLHLPAGKPVALTPAEAAVFMACNGVSCVSDICTRLCADPFGEFLFEDEVLEVLASLERRHRVDIGFVVRVGDPWPERHLRQQLARIAAEPHRADSLARLDLLESLREGVAAAAGDADALAAAMDALNQGFESVTSIAANRHAGVTYGARSVVHEDCVRDMSVTLSTELVARLHAPLDLVLTAARWLCWELAQRMRASLRDAFDACAGGAAVEVPFASFWLVAQGLLQGDSPMDTSDIEAQLSSRWHHCLGVDEHTGRQIQLRSASLRDAIAREFAAPGCGWRSACHQSPDLMIAASSPQALDSGEALFVLGELHLGINTLLSQVAVNQHPDAVQLLGALAGDLGAGRFMPLFSCEGSAQPIRVQTVVDSRRDTELCFAQDARPLEPERSVDVGSLVVRLRDDGMLRVAHRHGHWEADVLDVLGEVMSAFAVNRFRLSRRQSHLPRIVIDSLVVQRETWHVPYQQLLPVESGSRELPAEDFHAVHRCRRSMGMPDHVFVKLPWEVKPFHVAFDSPVSVRELLRQLRAAAGRGVDPATLIVVSEMLPGPGQAWLRDVQGHAFTSELRFVAVFDSDRHGSTPSTTPTTPTE